MFAKKPKDMESLLFLSLDLEEVRNCPNIRAIEEWVRPTPID
jgi:hypothetical protein